MATDVKKIIKDLIETDFSGSNEEQGKAAALFKGLAFSDDPAANKFMKKIDEYTSSLNVDDFFEDEGSAKDNDSDEKDEKNESVKGKSFSKFINEIFE